jgi:hypothetical protein
MGQRGLKASAEQFVEGRLIRNLEQWLDRRWADRAMHLQGTIRDTGNW